MLHPLEIVGIVGAVIIFALIVGLGIALIRWLNASRKAKGQERNGDK